MTGPSGRFTPTAMAQRALFLTPFITALLFVGCDSERAAGPIADAGPDVGDDAATTPPLTAAEVPPVAVGGVPASACPGAYGAAAPTEGLNDGFDSAGQSREFQLFLPPASFAGPRPIFFGLNGTGEDGPAFSTRAELGQFADRGFIVVAPSSNGNGAVWPIWDDMRMDGDTRPNADVALFDDLLACLGAHFEVDANRVYIGGHSAGGIFSNALLQRRSEVIAGGIVASGIFDLTSPPDLGALDPMFVLVTWGGPDDTYSGGVGVTVPEINFVEQASISSQFYEAEPTVGQAHCSITGTPSGHYWLPINDWFVDRLLEHPKGVPGNEADFVIAPSPLEGIECSAAPFIFGAGPALECPPSTPTGCQTACQLVSDCMVSNSTVGPVIGAQAEMFGFGSIDAPNCGGCVTKCEGDAGPGDQEIFDCLAPAVSMCGPGIDGFMPSANAINTCCAGRADSPWCVETCRVFRTNALATNFFTVCNTI